MIETIEKNGYLLSIDYDQDAENPRQWDNLGTLYIPRPPRHCAMSDDGASADEAAAAPVVLPVYVMDHSGIAISEQPFGCPWDSWRAGCLYVTKEKLLAEYGQDSPETRKIAKNCLRGELQEYAAYVSGDVYGYTITRENDGDVMDRCGGFYGEDGVKYIKELFEEFIKEQYKVDNPLFAYAGIDA
jgi:hypothetical protein